MDSEFAGPSLEYSSQNRSQTNVESLDQLILHLKSERNALLPISRLPGEVLSRIFLQLSRPGPGPYIKGLSWNWLIVTKVCRSWRKIALSFPELWTEIRSFSRKDKVEAFLERSRKADLYVSLGGIEPDAAVSFSILELIGENMDRVRELEISTSRTLVEWGAIQRLLAQSTHCLKVLDLRANPYSSWSWAENYGPSIVLDKLALCSTAIHLNELSLYGLFLPWNNLMFHGLTKLELVDIEEVLHRPTVSELLEILAASPNLESLKLISIGPRSSQKTSKKPIYLLSLKDVRIAEIDFGICNDLFDHIVMPKNANRSIECNNYPFENPMPFSQNLFNSTARTKHLSVTVSFNSYMIIFRSGGTTSTSLAMTWESSPAHLDRTINTLFAFIGSILKYDFWNDAKEILFSMSDLQVDDKDVMSSINTTAWSRLLGALPKIQSLTINFPDVKHLANIEIGLVTAMVQRIDFSNSYGFFCPCLIDLCLMWANFSTAEGRQAYKNLIEYLRYRSRLGSRLDQLEFIHCDGIEENDAEELKKMDIANVVQLS